MTKKVCLSAMFSIALAWLCTLPLTGQDAKEMAERLSAERIEVFVLFYTHRLAGKDEAEKSVAGSLQYLQKAFPKPQATDHTYHCLKAALTGDSQQIQAAIDQWKKAEPKSFDAEMVQMLWLLLKNQPAATEKNPDPLLPSPQKSFPDQWKTLLAKLKDPEAEFGEYSFQQSVSLLTRSVSVEEAISFHNQYLQRQSPSLADVHQSFHLISHYLSKQAEVGIQSLAKNWLECLERTMDVHLRVTCEQPDPHPRDLYNAEIFLNSYLREYGMRCLKWNESARGVAFYLKQKARALKRTEKNGDFVDFVDSQLDSQRLMLLARVDRKLAAQLAIDLLVKAQQQTPADSYEVYRLATALTEALLLVEKARFPAVVKVMRERGFLDFDKLKLFFQRPDADAHIAEANRVGIARMWNAYARRFYEHGAGANIAATFYRLRGMDQLQIQFESDEQPKYVIGKDEESYYLQQSLQFHLTLSQICFHNELKNLFRDLALEDELWLNVSAERRKEFAGATVVLTLLDNNELDNQKVKQQLQELNRACLEKFKNKVFFAVVVDDDGTQLLRDSWQPPTSIEKGKLPRRLEVLKGIGFPIIYAYRGKLLDHLTPWDGPSRGASTYPIRRTLIFDQNRVLKTVVFDNQDRFESEIDVIEKVLSLSEKASPSEKPEEKKQ